MAYIQNKKLVKVGQSESHLVTGDQLPIVPEISHLTSLSMVLTLTCTVFPEIN